MGIATGALVRALELDALKLRPYIYDPSMVGWGSAIMAVTGGCGELGSCYAAIANAINWPASTASIAQVLIIRTLQAPPVRHDSVSSVFSADSENGHGPPAVTGSGGNHWELVLQLITAFRESTRVANVLLLGQALGLLLDSDTFDESAVR